MPRKWFVTTFLDLKSSTAADDEQSDFYFESDHSCRGPPYKLPATSPPTNSGSNDNQNPRKAAPWTKDLKLKRNKNHMLKHFLHEQLTMALVKTFLAACSYKLNKF